MDAITTTSKYTERDAAIMMYNLASAVAYLHSMNIAHRDIKLENILVNYNFISVQKFTSLANFFFLIEI